MPRGAKPNSMISRYEVPTNFRGPRVLVEGSRDLVYDSPHELTDAPGGGPGGGRGPLRRAGPQPNRSGAARTAWPRPRTNLVDRAGRYLRDLPHAVRVSRPDTLPSPRRERRTLPVRCDSR